jgi:hypothetical protein
VLAAIRYYYAKLPPLHPDDLVMLWTKRGLTPATCEALGFRSSRPENKAILLAMKDLFPMEDLIQACLWVRSDRPGAEPKPNPQHHGWGVKGKEADGHEEFGWTLPILIPYLDAEGEVLEIRPHKRSQSGQAPRLYLPRPLKEFAAAFHADQPHSALITEGEFKAAAVWQALHGQIAVAALPGITMARLLLRDLEEWLERTRVRYAVVIYDNEEKSDPTLPGYKKESWKRHDSEVWARVLCKLLCGAGFEGRVGQLPKAWRDLKGKGDWDGALALLLQSATVVHTSARDHWAQRQLKIAAEFGRVITSGLRLEEIRFSNRYSTEDEKAIFKQVSDKCYVKKLPEGDATIDALSRRLWRVVQKTKGTDRLPDEARAKLRKLAVDYSEVVGCFYQLKEPSEATLQYWMEFRKKASDRSDVEIVRVCDVALQGIPEAVSDFLLEARFVLVKMDGSRDRMVRINPLYGPVTELLPLPAKVFASPSDFREWVLNFSSAGSWMTGERPLQALHSDVGKKIGHNEIYQVALRGRDDRTGIWFFGDIAFGPDGVPIKPDPKTGVVKYNGKKYLPHALDQENEEYRMGLPMLHPEVRCTEEELRDLFWEMSRRMFATIGSMAGYLVIGTFCAAAAGPELYAEYTGVPLLWVYGEARQGKSSVTRWGFRIWGYDTPAGLALANCTMVGINIAIQQYGYLPVWFEEFQANSEPWLIEKLKQLYDRTLGSKKNYEGIPRKVRSVAVVTGVATSSDAQLRSRFAHVHVAKENRLEEHYDWFEKNSRERFFLLGRYLMRNRVKFTEIMRKHMKEWCDSSLVAGLDSRARIVHGFGYAAWVTLAEMLKSHPPTEFRKFQQFLVNYVESAGKEVSENSFENLYWSGTLSAQQQHAFGETAAERRRFWLARPIEGGTSPFPEWLVRRAEELGRPFRDYVLYFVPDPILDVLRTLARRMGITFPVSKSDLRDQMKSQRHWYLPAPGKDGHYQRFEGGTKYCWAILVSQHPKGIRIPTPEEFEASLFAPDGRMYSPEEWVDPRKGELFTLIDSLAKRQKGMPE